MRFHQAKLLAWRHPVAYPNIVHSTLPSAAGFAPDHLFLIAPAVCIGTHRATRDERCKPYARVDSVRRRAEGGMSSIHHSLTN
jgi:hypothetical protein